MRSNLNKKLKQLKGVYMQELAKIEKKPKKWRRNRRSLFTKTFSNTFLSKRATTTTPARTTSVDISQIIENTQRFY
jgi:hypothetical protein